MIQFKRYTPADRDGVLRLLTEGMTPTEAAAKAATFAWQYGANPHDDGRSPFLVGWSNSEVVAVNGLMPARVVCNGTRGAAVWSCDSRVSTGLRGQGIGKDMMQRVGEECGLMLGYGMSDAMNVVLARLDWELSHDLAGYCFDARAPGVTGALKNLRSALYRLHRRRASKQPYEVTVHVDSDFGPAVDELWARSAPTYARAVERDSAYLNWRYRRHPLLSYRWYAAHRDGRLAGALVARPDPHLSVLVDYCGPLGDEELMANLVGAAVDDLRDGGTARIHCETTDAGMARALRLNGFRRSRGTYRFRARSHDPHDPHPSGRFFLMTGDSDNDFSAAFGAGS